MIQISDRQSWHLGAPSRRLDNLVVVIEHDGGRLVLAVGGRHQWRSNEPLPDEAKVVELVAVSSDDPASAVELWDVFLRYLHVGGSSGIERFLVSLGLRKIRVRVAISDQRVRDLVVSAIDKNRKAFRLVPLNA